MSSRACVVLKMLEKKKREREGSGRGKEGAEKHGTGGLISGPSGIYKSFQFLPSFSAERALAKPKTGTHYLRRGQQRGNGRAEEKEDTVLRPGSDWEGRER